MELEACKMSAPDGDYFLQLGDGGNLEVSLNPWYPGGKGIIETDHLVFSEEIDPDLGALERRFLSFNLEAKRPAENLMSQADAKYRHLTQ